MFRGKLSPCWELEALYYNRKRVKECEEQDEDVHDGNEECCENAMYDVNEECCENAVYNDESDTPGVGFGFLLVIFGIFTVSWLVDVISFFFGL